MDFALIFLHCQLLIYFIADAPQDNNPFSLSPPCIIQAVSGPLSPQTVVLRINFLFQFARGYVGVIYHNV